MAKPKKIIIHIELDIDKNGDYDLFGTPSYICPDCDKTKEGIKTCIMDNLAMLFEEYGVETEDKMDKGAIELRRKLRDCVVIENV